MLDKKLNNEDYILLGGRASSGCQEANPGCLINNEGYCIPSERQSGGVSHSCLPIDDCPREEEDTKSTLIEAGESTPEITNQKLYIIRDEILSTTIKGKKYIDDYYYCSKVFNTESITIDMELAIDLVDLINTDFFDVLVGLNDYQNDSLVPITELVFNKLNLIFAQTKLLSDDERFQSIISSLENDVELYKYKTIIQIRNDF
ncbi:MAG TPA: hypothetical protein PKY29_02045 [Ferruginibacter sp.]|nr:hypothetical protein [Ferruginibacter sp.]HRO17101.1 hypothetical protein [Ferruginibacter sp.]HRQ20062.1 hypothetical protein [Ferruginibacter sp.]